MTVTSVSLPVPPMVPTCQILRTTAPSAWTSSSLTSMSSSAFSNCLELMGQDPFLTSYQRGQILGRVKQVCVSCSLCFFFLASYVTKLCFHLRLTTSPLSLSSPSVPRPESVWNNAREDLRPSVLLLPVVDLTAGESGCRAVSGGAGEPQPD